ncbi:hypothetical protein L1987_87800 [Smallanthus sonchifolius]|nr:hypothetical protein L1987_87800 [Smallanthus sonchifolius]
MSELQKKRNGGFWFREWDRVDVTHLSLSIGKHVLAVCALFVPNWRAFWVAVALSYLTGMGVTLGYHRLLTHRSFKVPKWLEYIIVYCGLQASQEDFLTLLGEWAWEKCLVTTSPSLSTLYAIHGVRGHGTPEIPPPITGGWHCYLWERVGITITMLFQALHVME